MTLGFYIASLLAIFVAFIVGYAIGRGEVKAAPSGDTGGGVPKWKRHQPPDAVKVPPPPAHQRRSVQ